MSRIPRDLIRHLEWDPTKVLPLSPSPPGNKDVNPPASAVTSSGEYWTIDNVLYRGESRRVDLLKKLLEDGAVHNQDEWSAHYKVAKDLNGFHAPDYPLFYGLVKALRSVKGDSAQGVRVKEARTFLQNTARAKWLMTLSRINYQSHGLDKILHNHGTADEYGTNMDFVGKDEFLKDTLNAAPYQALLGTEDGTIKIDDIFRWLNGTGAYMWRLNTRPEVAQDRVARFIAYSSGANLGCDWGPQNANGALGVRVVRAKN